MPSNIVGGAAPSEEFFENVVGTQILYLNVPENVEAVLNSVRIYIDGTNVRPDGSVGRPLNSNCPSEEENRRIGAAEAGFDRVEEVGSI